MAGELKVYSTTGLTLYAVLINSIGQIWDGAVFETIAAGTWTDYDITLTESTAGIYLGTIPAVIAGVYEYLVYKKLGANPAITDTLMGSGSIEWNGTAEIISLEPTVAGKKLDVSDTGEAGLDFANLKNATAPTTLTNITVPAVASVTALAAGAIPDDEIDAGSIKADAVTKIQSGLATPTNITAGTITTATNLTNLPVMPNDWVTAAGLKADAVDKIIDEIIEGALTFREIIRIMMAVLFGKSTGGGTVDVTFRDLADGKPRVTAVVDSVGNRTSVTLDGS